MIYQNPIFWAILVLLGAVGGYFIRELIAAKQLSSLDRKVKKQVEDSQAKANGIILDAQEKATSLLEESKKTEREQKIQMSRLEERLVKKEEAIEKQTVDLKQEQEIVKTDIEKINLAKAQISELKAKLSSELEKISKLSESEAKDKLLKEVEGKYKQDLAQSIQKLLKEQKEEIERRGMDIMTTAMQRLSRSYVSEVTTTVFNLDDDELKGKIIGREGRNIRALERATGVEFIIDETPGSVIVSSFDPVRREIARLTLEKLIK